MNKRILFGTFVLGIAILPVGQAQAIPEKEQDVQRSKWYIQVLGGGLAAQNHGVFLIDNGSDYPAPENVDVYTSKNTTQGMVALTVGKQYPVLSSVVSHYTLGARVHYLIPERIRGTVMQYSLPQFLNYTYSRTLSALAVTAEGKVNLLHWSVVSPYLNAGLGISFNQMKTFSETALPGVTPRVSPGFSNHMSPQFTYHIGAGVDFEISDKWSCSAGYEYEDFGRFRSGSGQWTWAGAGVLPFGSYHAHTALFGLTYLID